MVPLQSYGIKEKDAMVRVANADYFRGNHFHIELVLFLVLSHRFSVNLGLNFPQTD